jgi:hypothetical protein
MTGVNNKWWCGDACADMAIFFVFFSLVTAYIVNYYFERYKLRNGLYKQTFPAGYEGSEIKFIPYPFRAKIKSLWQKSLAKIKSLWQKSLAKIKSLWQGGEYVKKNDNSIMLTNNTYVKKVKNRRSFKAKNNIIIKKIKIPTFYMSKRK